jgi:hypothetical protein
MAGAGSQAFGYSVDLSPNGQTLAVGANGGQGFVEVFEYVSGSSWNARPVISGPSGATFYTGSDVAVTDGSRVGTSLKWRTNFNHFARLTLLFSF